MCLGWNGLTSRVHLSIPLRCDWNLTHYRAARNNLVAAFYTTKVRLKLIFTSLPASASALSIPLRCDWNREGQIKFMEQCQLSIPLRCDWNRQQSPWQTNQDERLSIPLRCDWNPGYALWWLLRNLLSIPLRCDWNVFMGWSVGQQALPFYTTKVRLKLPSTHTTAQLLPYFLYH